MCKWHFEDTFSQIPDELTIKNYLALKQVDDAIKLFAFNQLNNPQLYKEANEKVGIIEDVKYSIQKDAITDNLKLYCTIYDHLKTYEYRIVDMLRNSKLTNEGIGILFSLFQAYQELSMIDLPAGSRVPYIESDFQKYLESINSRFDW